MISEEHITKMLREYVYYISIYFLFDCINGAKKVFFNDKPKMEKL